MIRITSSASPHLLFALPHLGNFSVHLFLIMSAGHDMQPPSNPHQPHASTEERLAEEAREIQQPREQLARASVKEGPALPLCQSRS